MITIDRVVKSFPVAYGLVALVKNRGKLPRRAALKGITLSVNRGELLGLLGPNGAGKTTLLKLLATQSIPDSGSIVVDGIDVVKHPLEAKRRIGLCTSEDRSFYFRLTARANLEFFGALMGFRGRSLQKRIDEVIELVDLGASIDRRYESYSSGMRQRLNVARALLGDPEVMLLDEPTRAVDPVHADDLRQFIRDELVDRYGKTVIFATNLLDEAWQLCDRVAVVNNGKLVALGPPASLDSDLHRVSRFQITFDTVTGDALAWARTVEGLTVVKFATDHEGVKLDVEIESSEASLASFVQALTGNGVILRSLKSVEAHPVEVFRRVTMENGESDA